MDHKKCFFIGHKDASESVYPLLQGVVKQHIKEYGVKHFIVGKYGAFDRLAARAVIDAKQNFPDITLTLLLPYHPVVEKTELPKGFNDSLYPSGMERVPHRYAIVRANRYAVDHVDYLIAYAWQSGSNAVALVKYAENKIRRNTLTVTNIAEKIHIS